MSEVAIKVAVRVRPFNRREMEQNQRNIIKVIDDSTLIFDPEIDEDEFFFHGAKQTHRDITKRVKKKLNMDFSSVFNDEATNEEVFESCMKPLVTSVMNGYNCSVFVYGATGAGKTFTMLGNEEFPGITFLTMRELFAHIDRLSEERRFDIGISYLEVYNEQVMNLLTKSGPLKLREDSTGVVVGGLVLKQIHNANELIDLLILGNRNRTQHPTDANAESSRSHAIFQVHIRMIDKKSNIRRTVKLSMIDLAGSERAQSTKCIGLRFKEGANINKSLLALGNCINKLADGCKHIPYRDSNLTRILKDSLGGNCQTLMIANISPSSLTYEDTYNTLKYASRAKKIRTTCKQNVINTNMSKEFMLKRCNDQHSEIERLKAENEKLKERNTQLEMQILDHKTDSKIVNGSGDSGHSPRNVDLSGWHARIDTIYANFRKAHEKCLSLQSNEKILNFRIKFKERYEEVKKILSLDGSRLENDLTRLEASIDKYGKEAARIKNEDMTRWVKRFKEANKALDHLKKEIEGHDLAPALELYVQKKNVDMDNSKMMMKNGHVNKINSVYQLEMENWNRIVVKASQIIQENYLLLRATGSLDNDMLEKLQTLVRLLQGQRQVKFADDETASSNENHSQLSDGSECTTFQNILNLTDYADNFHSSPSSASKKRVIDGIEEIDTYGIEPKRSKNSTMADFAFVRPKALKSINFNAPPSNSEENGDLNVTFDLNSKPKLSRKPLHEQNTKSLLSNSAVSKALRQVKASGSSSKFGHGHVSKENIKKFSPTANRVRKTTQTPNRAVGKAPTLLANRAKLAKLAVGSSLVTSSTDKIRTASSKK